MVQLKASPPAVTAFAIVREASPLAEAEGALVVDTSALSVDEIVDELQRRLP